MSNIEGILVPLITCFTKQEEIDFENIQRHIAKLDNTAVNGYFVLGSCGEWSSLNDEEQLKVIHAAREAATQDKVFVVGIGRQSAYATIEFGKKVQNCGVDYVSILTPCYYASLMTDTNLIKFYSKVADELKIPIILYNCPEFAGGVTLSAAVLRELSQHPYICGMKDTSTMPIEDYLCNKGEDFFVMSGTIDKLIKALDNGGNGGVLSIANYLPDKISQMYTMYKSGNRTTALEIAESLIEIDRRIYGDGGIAGVKIACKLLNYIDEDMVRSPLYMPNQDVQDNIARSLKKFGYLKPV